MGVTTFQQRLAENHDLLKLMARTNFDRYERGKTILPKPVENVYGDKEFTFTRLINQKKGVEIFYFDNPKIWYMDDQMAENGFLRYYCLATKERIEYELNRSSNISTLAIADGKTGTYDQKLEYTVDQNTLKLNVMYPDKWSQMALELLLRYAKVKTAADIEAEKLRSGYLLKSLAHQIAETATYLGGSE